MKQQLPIGRSNFKSIIEEGYYFVDKSLQDAIRDASEQLRKRNYANEMRQQGIVDILQLAVAVQGKDLIVQEVV